MSRIRFTTARDVFEAFPAAQGDITAPPTDAPTLAFLAALARSDTPEDAVAFCAYILPRREAVWWACQCVRSLSGVRDGAGGAGLKAAEHWVREPEEERRRDALEIGMGGDRGDPTTWLALAAAWSGGSMTAEPQAPVLAPPHLTAKAVKAAVLTALARVPLKERQASLSACLREGLKIAGADAGAPL
jgi:hypothetical protein